MRFAVISDIHSNIEALTAVLHQISRLETDLVFCLGDIVGYGPNPIECLEMIKREGISCILGNHDAVAAGLKEPDNFSPIARQAILWTRKQLEKSHLDFLARLPREMLVQDMFMFHGSVHDIDRYILDAEDVKENFGLLISIQGRPHIGFFGHTHAKITFSLHKGVIEAEHRDRILVWDEKKYLVNPGSVGQPRDGDPRASFCIYDSAEKSVIFHRVTYDISLCQEKIIKYGLPPRLAERLSEGW